MKLNGLEFYKEEWDKLWDKYLVEMENHEESVIEDDLRNLLNDIADEFGVSTSVAFKWMCEYDN